MCSKEFAIVFCVRRPTAQFSTTASDCRTFLDARLYRRQREPDLSLFRFLPGCAHGYFVIDNLLSVPKEAHRSVKVSG